MIKPFDWDELDYGNKFEIPTQRYCPKCGSEDIIIRICPDANQARIVCLECKFNEAIKHLDPSEKRSATAHGKWAAKVKQRDGFRCRICGTTEDLNAHHIIPVSHDKTQRYVYSIENGITVCDRCHKMIHYKEN